MMLQKVIILLFLSVVASLQSITVSAQQQLSKLASARNFAQNKEYEKAIPFYKAAYEEAPFDKSVYTEYLQTLLQAEKYEDAEKLVKYMSTIRKEDASIWVDLGKVYELWGKKKESENYYNKAIENLSGDDYNTRSIAEAFIRNNKKDFAIKAYEHTRDLLQNPYLYSNELSALYDQTGNTADALSALMNSALIQPNALEEVKSSLLKMAGSDKKKLAEIQKEIASRIKKDPDNPIWNELQNWLYTQNGDYDKALQAAISLDKKQKEQGERVLSFASMADKDGQYQSALKAYDYVLAKGKDNYLYEKTLLDKIALQTRLITSDAVINTALLQETLKNYNDLFVKFPNYKNQQPYRNYAMLQARYAHNIDTAIGILNEVIQTPGLPKDFVGNCKLDLGDYLILKQKLWEASLIYSQVDKDFKEDVLGEEARFRNAKLAYYRGDFPWAQSQLSVLKASTTELIANDALFLSVLITENIPPDSNITPLLRFAAADLLLFQNKTKESDQLLDSIARAFPENPLQDDILFLRAKIAEQESRHTDAIQFLTEIVDKYGTDVLGDDAVYNLALIYQDKIKDKSKALAYFEKLITDYPGSTFVQQARVRYNELKNGTPVP